MATTPPTLLGNDDFGVVGDTLHVPKGCLAAYKSSKWNDAFSVIVEQK
jgi:hypothetical protein